MIFPSPLPMDRRRSVPAAGAADPVTGTGPSRGVGEPDLRADLPRTEPAEAEGTGELLVPFAARLLATLDRSAANAVCSPVSAQIALTMIGLGAAGRTRAQMETVLGGDLDQLAGAANTLAAVLAAVGDSTREAAREATDPRAPESAVASLAQGTWLQQGMEIQADFLTDLARYFGSGVFEADFTDGSEREAARTRINSWVAGATGGLIQELLGQGVLEESTRLVLVNALHLKAAWRQPLTTGEGVFTTGDGKQVSVQMLSGTASHWYQDELCRATALDTYGDELALAVVQPVGDLSGLLDAWSSSAAQQSQGLGALLAGLESSAERTQLTMPGFDLATSTSLNEPLEQLGLVDAFGDAADFSGATGGRDLLISHVLQKAVITVDQHGMEAAAATAVVMAMRSAPMAQHELVLDSPFLVVAYEKTTRAPLVIALIGDPTLS